MNNNKNLELIKDLVLLSLIETDSATSIYIGEIESVDDYLNKGIVTPAFFHYYIKEEINFSMNYLIITNMIEVASNILKIEINETETNLIATEIFNRHVEIITNAMKDIGI